MGFRVGDIAGEGDEEPHVETFMGMSEVAGETVENAAEAGGLLDFVEEAEAIVPGVAAVDDDGEIGGLGEFHLLAADCFLDVAGRVVVEIIETNFAPGEYFGMFGQGGESFEMGRRDFFGVVGMDAYRGVDPVVGFGVGECGVELFRTRASAYG